MADSKITALAALTAADPVNDMFPVVDVSDTSMAASGTTKRISANNILSSSPTASGALTVTGLVTAGSANVTGDLKAGTTNNFASSRLCVQGTAGTSTPDVTIGIPVNSSGNTGLAIGRSASTSGYIFLDAYKAAVGGTELVLNSINGGSVLIGLSTVVAAGGCLQLKSGITFPATQVASSDANTLDDYEEGTWTPTVAASSGTPTTVTIGTCKYTKIGRQVICTFNFTVVDKGTASGSFIFSLPFVSDSFYNCGSFRENGLTGNMGQVFYNSASDVAAFLYNNTTVWSNGYKVLGTYSYCV